MATFPPLLAALAASVSVVNTIVRRYCFQGIVIEFDGPRPDPSVVRLKWDAYNLLGVMYLQMYWIMFSGGTLARCEQCRRVISLAKPNPEGRKRRRDKRFCDDACRQAHHRSKKRTEDAPF